VEQFNEAANRIRELECRVEELEEEQEDYRRLGRENGDLLDRIYELEMQLKEAQPCAASI